jgi:hypothetical protein
MLENNIQMALQQQNIDLEDAIDLREIKSVRLANQLLKIRRRKKLERDRQQQMQNIQAQADSNAQAAQQAAQIELQKNQALTQSQIQIEEAKSQFGSLKLQQEMAAKKELMELEFQYNMQLKGMETRGYADREKMREDRKDERTKIQATQQSEMIEQRKSGNAPKKFESAGNDTMGEGFSLEAFGPK